MFSSILLPTKQMKLNFENFTIIIVKTDKPTGYINGQIILLHIHFNERDV